MKPKILNHVLPFGFALFLCIPVSEVGSSNILFFHDGATASHRTSIWPLATKLADAGHKVTYIYPLTRRPGSHPKIEELLPSKMTAAVEDFVGEFDINFRLNGTTHVWLQDVFDITVDFCEAFYDSPEVHEWLSRPGLHYDLILMDGCMGQCIYPLVHKLKAKHILFYPVTLANQFESFGVLAETSSVPFFMLNQKATDLPNSLLSRTINTLEPLIAKYAMDKSIRKMVAIGKSKLNLTDMPSFEEIQAETSLIFLNAYFIEDYPMSLPPMFVSYSGLLCTKKSIQERKPLPEKLEAFVNDTQVKGFIYVSFGSAVRPDRMPENFRNLYFAAFAAFPNLRFLWRWAGPIPKNAPKNVMFQSWFPQMDVLNHPKIMAFITQAGRPSAQEAICYGVPMITFPIFADQDTNAERLENLGISLTLEITTITAKELQTTIEEIVQNDKYKKRASQLSSMFRDRPMDPVENLQFWVEYVLRHDTSLMKPLAIKQSWWQRRLLDVYALLFTIVVIFLFVILTIFFIGCKLATKYLRLRFFSSDKIRKSD